MVFRSGLLAGSTAIVQQFPAGDAFRLGLAPHRFDHCAVLVLVNDLGPVDVSAQVGLFDDYPVDRTMWRLGNLTKTPVVLERKIEQLLSNAVSLPSVAQGAWESSRAKFH